MQFGESSDRVMLYIDSTSGVATWAVYGSQTNAFLLSASSSFFETNTWVHVVATVEGTTMKLYKNGTLTDTKAD